MPADAGDIDHVPCPVEAEAAVEGAEWGMYGLAAAVRGGGVAAASSLMAVKGGGVAAASSNI